MREWWVVVQDQKTGPFDFHKLRREVKEGHLSPDMLVWSAPMEDWCKAGKVAGLFETSATPPPTPKVRILAEADKEIGEAEIVIADAEKFWAKRTQQLKERKRDAWRLYGESCVWGAIFLMIGGIVILDVSSDPEIGLFRWIITSILGSPVLGSIFFFFRRASRHSP